MPSMTISSQGRPCVTGSSFVPVPMEQVAAAWPRRLFTYCTTMRTYDTVELGTLILDRLSQTSQFLNFQVLEPRISETNPLCFFQLCRTIPLSSDWVFKVTLAASLPVHAKQLLWDLQRFHTSWPENGSQWRIQRNNQKQETCFLR